jgi:hypothetical protein
VSSTSDPPNSSSDAPGANAPPLRSSATTICAAEASFTTTSLRLPPEPELFMFGVPPLQVTALSGLRTSRSPSPARRRRTSSPPSVSVTVAVSPENAHDTVADAVCGSATHHASATKRVSTLRTDGTKPMLARRTATRHTGRP